jgi:putative oxidoreductase
MIIGYGFRRMVTPSSLQDQSILPKYTTPLGVTMPELMGWVTIVVELLGGLALLMGAFVPWVSIPLAAILLVSVFTVLLPYGFLSIKLQAATSNGVQLGTPRYEVDLV